MRAYHTECRFIMQPLSKFQLRMCLCQFVCPDARNVITLIIIIYLVARTAINITLTVITNIILKISYTIQIVMFPFESIIQNLLNLEIKLMLPLKFLVEELWKSCKSDDTVSSRYFTVESTLGAYGGSRSEGSSHYFH